MTLATTQIARLVVHSRPIPAASPRSLGLASQSSPSMRNEYASSADEQESDRSRIEAMNTLVSVLKRNTRVRYEVDAAELLKAYVSLYLSVLQVARLKSRSVQPALSDTASKESRTSAYRLLRYALVEAEAVDRFHELQLDWYLVRYEYRFNFTAVRINLLLPV
jgi:hypothetical protein